MKTLPSVSLKNTQLIGFFQKRKMDQKFLLIDFDSWSELSGSLMAIRKLVQEIKVPNATMWLIEKCGN